MRVWAADDADLKSLLAADPEVAAHLEPAALAALFDYDFYTREVDTILARVDS
jgi:adenylosuccinate lyase